MAKKTSSFYAGPTNKKADYTMAYICAECSKPGLAYSNDEYGMYVGTCANNHQSTVMAS